MMDRRTWTRAALAAVVLLAGGCAQTHVTDRAWDEGSDAAVAADAGTTRDASRSACNPADPEGGACPVPAAAADAGLTRGPSGTR